MTLPAICSELCLRAEAGVPVVNSRDVAELFDKRHDHVLRDIEAILTSPSLGALPGWVRHSDYLDAKGEKRPSFDLTRQGFTLLVMGWTGERAMSFKVRYIEAFDAMEAAMKEEIPPLASLIISGLREAIAPLAIRLEGQDGAIERIERRQDSMAEDLAAVKARILNGRKLLKGSTKAEHIDAVARMGGHCPCCRTAIVVIAGEKTSFADFDHFYQNSRPDADHTWLICRPCHNDLTFGRIPRDQREAEFRAYQQQRRRLPGRQISLW